MKAFWGGGRLLEGRQRHRGQIGIGESQNFGTILVGALPMEGEPLNPWHFTQPRS